LRKNTRNMSENFDLKEFIRSIRYLPKVELRRLCIECEMSDRETYAITAYIYDMKGIAEIANTLNMSISQFNYNKERVAKRLWNYLKLIDYPV